MINKFIQINNFIRSKQLSKKYLFCTQTQFYKYNEKLWIFLAYNYFFIRIKGSEQRGPYRPKEKQKILNTKYKRQKNLKKCPRANNDWGGPLQDSQSCWKGVGLKPAITFPLAVFVPTSLLTRELIFCQKLNEFFVTLDLERAQRATFTSKSHAKERVSSRPRKFCVSSCRKKSLLRSRKGEEIKILDSSSVLFPRWYLVFDANLLYTSWSCFFFFIVVLLFKNFPPDLLEMVKHSF